MTTKADIVNLALQAFGSRTTVTDAELLANGSNEAIQANLTYNNTRDSLLRMAPWDFATATLNMSLISATPGTPENTSPATNLWQPGQPPPPWAYEYQYPADCLRACWIIPSTQTGFAGNVPITTAITGGAPSTWLGSPIRFRIQSDQFVPVTAAAVVSGGVGYAVGDIITLASGPTDAPPLGAPAQLLVGSVVAGVITSVSVISQIIDANPPFGGSYFAAQTNPVAQGSTDGLGSGATFNLTFGAKGNQRVILCNQEFATLTYIRQITDPNVWDPIFQDAMAGKLGADIVMGLTGDKPLANACIQMANMSLTEARKVDGNEGLTVSDVTPDWIRARGIWWTDGFQSGPYNAFDWGGLLPTFF